VGAGGSIPRPSTTSTPGKAARTAGGAATFHERLRPSRMIRSRCMTRAHPDRQVGGQAEDRHAAQLHAGDRLPLG
jgi:hypothetical protein